MQTTLYFANNQLQILQGDYKNHALTVEKYLRVPMTPGGLINGVITNEAILLDALNRASSDYDVDFKNTSLVINTSLAIYKNIQVPKLKPAELEELCSHEFEDAPNYEDLVMDYKGIPGHDGGTNMFAVAIEKGVLESYTALFEAAGIKLKRIDTALSAWWTTPIKPPTTKTSPTPSTSWTAITCCTPSLRTANTCFPANPDSCPSAIPKASPSSLTEK